MRPIVFSFLLIFLTGCVESGSTELKKDSAGIAETNALVAAVQNYCISSAGQYSAINERVSDEKLPTIMKLTPQHMEALYRYRKFDQPLPEILALMLDSHKLDVAGIEQLPIEFLRKRGFIRVYQLKKDTMAGLNAQLSVTYPEGCRISAKMNAGRFSSLMESFEERFQVESSDAQVLTDQNVAVYADFGQPESSTEESGVVVMINDSESNRVVMEYMTESALETLFKYL